MRLQSALVLCNVSCISVNNADVSLYKFYDLTVLLIIDRISPTQTLDQRETSLVLYQEPLATNFVFCGQASQQLAGIMHRFLVSSISRILATERYLADQKHNLLFCLETEYLHLGFHILSQVQIPMHRNLLLCCLFSQD